MSSAMLAAEEQRRWAGAAAIALAAHVALGALVLGWTQRAEPPAPEPVVLVELSPEAAPAPVMPAEQPHEQPQPEQPQVTPRVPTPPIDVPPVRAPMPKDAVTLPPPVPGPDRPAVASAPAAPAQASSAPQRSAPVNAPNAVGVDDPKAKRQAADYFALVSAHLNRRKVYPIEARKARQEGVVTVRFTVDRNGNVSAVSIKRGSGHALLDQATLDLLQRVAPLPRMPASMQRDSITLSLPIDYSLRTN